LPFVMSSINAVTSRIRIKLINDVDYADSIVVAEID